jgi:hypothetical protein
MAIQAIGTATALTLSPTQTAKAGGAVEQADSAASTVVISRVTVTNSDGSTTTTITYADGHTETETTPAKQSASGQSGGQSSGSSGGQSGGQSDSQSGSESRVTAVNLLV